MCQQEEVVHVAPTVPQRNFASAYLWMTVIGANFVTSCEIQLLRKPGRHRRCQIYLYSYFRRRRGHDCAYRKLCHRIRRRRVDFSTSFVEKPDQVSRMSSRKKCSISLPMSAEYVSTTPCKRSWRVAQHPSCSTTENH